MSKRKSAPVIVPDSLNGEQRAMVEGASSDAARLVLIRLYARLNSR